MPLYSQIFVEEVGSERLGNRAIDRARKTWDRTQRAGIWAEVGRGQSAGSEDEKDGAGKNHKENCETSERCFLRID